MALCLVALVAGAAAGPAASPTVASVREEIAKLKADMASLWGMAQTLALVPGEKGQAHWRAPAAAHDASGAPHPGRQLLINGGPVLKLEVCFCALVDALRVVEGVGEGWGGAGGEGGGAAAVGAVSPKGFLLPHPTTFPCSQRAHALIPPLPSHFLSCIALCYDCLLDRTS